MQDVRRKRGRGPRHGRAAWLLLALAALAAALGAWLLPGGEDAPPPEHHADAALTLMAHGAEEVERVAVTLRNGEGWAALQTAPGALALEDDPAFPVDEGYAALILNAARIVSCEAVLTDDPARYRDDLTAFGLDAPRLIAEIAYADGERVTLRVGDAIPAEGAAWYYMTVDGDDRLFAVDRGTVEDLTVDRSLLYPVTQPVLHAARLDHVTLTGPGGALIGEWALDGDVGDADAGDRWRLVAPVAYPADAEAMAAFRANLAAIRLGAYVGPATRENLAACGFDAPRLTIAAHQAAGRVGAAGASGAFELTDWPESDFTLTVGGARSEDVDYVRYGDEIYVSSHYLLAVFMEKDWAGTLSRYLTPTALGNLARLTVTTASGVDEYVLSRVERVAENNELVTGQDGGTVYDYACTLNGEAIDYGAFEAAYARLIMATVSGALPEGWTPREAPHTTYAFHDVSGDVHTVAFAAFDALHDAVIVDGVAVFYLMKGGYGLS